MTERTLHKAAPRDRAAILRYLRAEPEVNLFIVGDILTLGISSDISDLFIQGPPRGIEGVLFRWRTSLLPYAHDPSADLSPLAGQANRFLAQPGEWMLSGKQAVVRAVEARLRRRPDHAQDHFLCVCRKLTLEVPLPQLPLVRPATGADAPAINALLARIEEFHSPRLTDAELRAEIAGGRRRIALVRDPADHRLLSMASAVAETGDAAMIIAVATDPEFRGRGYASACVARLVKGLNRRGRSACLFYNNPVAGRIYQRLGFREIGRWRMLTFGRR